MAGFAIWAIGLLSVFGVIILQMILPFAFDLISTLGVFGLGVFVGRKMTS